MALRTDKELVAEFNLPSTRTVRTMRQQGLPAIKLGKGYLYDQDDVHAFIAKRKVFQCLDRTGAPTSNSLSNGARSTSTGAKAEQRASDQQALRTVEKLKRLSLSSSKDAEASSELGRVTRANFQSPTH